MFSTLLNIFIFYLQQQQKLFFLKNLSRQSSCFVDIEEKLSPKERKKKQNRTKPSTVQPKLNYLRFNKAGVTMKKLLAYKT